MGTQITNQEIYYAPEGAQIQPQDWDNIFTTMDNAVGWLLAALGIVDALPSSDAVTCVPFTGLEVSVGGTNQFMVCQGKVLDVCSLTNLTLATANPTYPRIDLVAVQATRVEGQQTITRNVRPDSATSPMVVLTGTLSGGAATVELPSGYTVAPVIAGLAVVGADSTAEVTVASVSTTQAVFQSSDSADARSFAFLVYGNPTGSTGTATTINLYENRPEWQIVTGTPAASPVAPGAPNGCEAFAEVLVPANATSITTGDITILFSTLPSLAGPSNVLAANGSSPLLGGGILKWGSLASVKADGSAVNVAISFNAPFPNEVFQCVPAIDTGSTDSGTELSIKMAALTTAGFTVTVSGGSPSETVTVRYTATGA